MTSPDSVTTDVTYVTTSMILENELQNVSLFNIPGLIEINNKNFSRNKAAMDTVFATSERQVVLFVFGNNSGRPDPLSAAAFLALRDAYELNPASVLFVFNLIPAFTDEQKARFVYLVSQSIEWEGPMNYEFVGTLPEDLSDEACVTSRAALIEHTEFCLPAPHHKVKDIMFDEEKINALKVRLVELDQRLKDEAAAHAQVVASYDQQIQYWQRVAAENNNNKKKKGWFGRALAVVSGAAALAFL